MPEALRQALYDALADPALRRERQHLCDLERMLDADTTTPAQVALIPGIVARMRQQWDQVEAVCRPLVVAGPGSRRVERAQAWYLLGQAADAREQWLAARDARRQVRALIRLPHPLWLSSGILDLEQAIRRGHRNDAAGVRRWLGRAEHLAPPAHPIQFRLDLAWLDGSRLCRQGLDRNLSIRLQRACAWILHDTASSAAGRLAELVRLLRIAVDYRPIDVACQILSRLDHPLRPPDGRPAVAVEVDILGGRAALAGGRLEPALRRYATAAVGLAMLAADDPERNRLHRDLQRLEVAVHQASRHEPASVP